ncbi:MAG: hypothetical protein HYZ85_03750, partial [Candidatus Omnitrophica bacterium]|nr:hypothetical protein [Candidatus Omnitrophota bacterium]
ILFFNLSYDIASKAILEKIYQEGMVTKKVGVEMSGKSEKGDRLGNQPVPFFGFELKRVYSLLHKSCEIHVVMNILTLLSVINLTWKGFEGRWIFIYYAVCVPGMTLVKFCHVIINKKVDGEYEEKLRG